MRVDIDAAIQICRQEWYVQIPLCNDGTRLRIHLINIILSGSKVDVLDAIGRSVEERLEEDLFRDSIVLPRERRLEDLAELSTPNDRRIHIMITAWSVITRTRRKEKYSHLVASSRIITTPSDGIGGSQRVDMTEERQKEKKERGGN
jgi:hypothetical protein